MTYANHHTHTIYSRLDGHGQVEAYVKRAKELGMSGISITDHGNLSGWMDWYDAGQKYDFNTLLGIEAYQARKTRFDDGPEELSVADSSEFKQKGPYHLTVIAVNNAGYQNVIELSSRAFLEGNVGGKPRIDHQLIDEHKEGICVLSGCLGGEVCQALLRDDFEQALKNAAIMQEIVGKENYFIEVMNHGIDEELKVLPDLERIAKAIGAPIVPTGDCHYVHKDDAESHDVMLAVGTRATVNDENRFSFDGEGFYLKSYEEMCKVYPKEWVDNTNIIAERNEVKIDRGEFHFPSFDVPTEESTEEYLERLTWEGALKRYGDPLPTEVVDRIEYELRVIKKLGFASYFLVVSDLIRWGKKRGIRYGPGRGSAAGACVSYCLNITDLDPLYFGLIFERFLVPEEVEYDPVFEEA